MAAAGPMGCSSFLPTPVTSLKSVIASYHSLYIRQFLVTILSLVISVCRCSVFVRARVSSGQPVTVQLLLSRPEVTRHQRQALSESRQDHNTTSHSTGSNRQQVRVARVLSRLLCHEPSLPHELSARTCCRPLDAASTDMKQVNSMSIL